jgi:hypothetical protein
LPQRPKPRRSPRAGPKSQERTEILASRAGSISKVALEARREELLTPSDDIEHTIEKAREAGR